MALPLYVPLAYIVLLVAALSAFSRIHRRRAAGRLAADATTQPWFPGGHPERDVYQTLVAADAAAQEDGKARVPENVLRAALMSRAMADVRRLRRLREDKVALAVLLQRGSLGDVTAERFALAEKELEAELLDTASEANSFHPGWGQVLFQQANEMVNHVKVKETYYAISANREAHKQKLKAAGKQVPQPKVDIPPLFTPPGTQIQVPAGAPPPPPGAGGQQVPIKLPPQIAAAMQATGGKITPQMLPAIAAANGGQLPPPLMAMVMQARAAQMQAQQAQQAEDENEREKPAVPAIAAGSGIKAATVEEAEDE